MIRRTTIFTAAALFVLMCTTRPQDGENQSMTSAAPAARYSSEAGSTPVGVIPDASLHDDARGRDVSLTIDYPIAAGPHPLIVFSHGFGATGRAYVGLSSHWASNGYIVIKPTHAADASVKLADVGPSTFADRAADVKFVLDSLPALQQKYPELQGKIDTAKIAVGGHSLGALTAMLIGGLRTAGGKSYADPRVKAVIAMSPQGPRESWGLTKDSWAEMHGPVLYMTGDRDKGIDDSETPEWRRQAFELSPAGDKWLVFIQGAGHLAFTGRLGVMPQEERRETTSGIPDTTTNPFNPPATSANPEQRRPQMMGDPVRGVSGTIKAVSLAFLDAYLRADTAGREFLDKVSERSGVEVKKK